MFLNIGFSNEWWHVRYGLDFGRDTYMDPLKKVEMQDRMDDVLYERYGKWGFLDHLSSVGTLSRPSVAVEPYGHRIIPALFGAPVRYQKDQAPWACANILDREQIMALTPITREAFAQQPCVKEVIRQYETLKATGRTCSAQQNLGSCVNTISYLRGMDFFYDFVDDPELVHTLNSRITEMILMAYSYFAEYDGMIAGMGVGNCSVAMLSPNVYREFFYPYDRRIMERARELGIPFHIHQDSCVDPFIPEYRAFEHLQSFDVGDDTDVGLFRQNFPDILINVFLYTKTLRTLKPEALYDFVLKLAQKGRPYENIGFSAYDIDLDVEEDRIVALCEAYRTLSREEN